MSRRVLITRNAEDCRLLEELVSDCGILIEPYPVLRFEALESEESWRRVLAAVASAREDGRVSWLILASPRAPRPLCLQAPRYGGKAILGLPTAAVGKTSAEAARKLGIRVAIEGPGTGTGLAAEINFLLHDPAFFVFACGKEHRPELPEELERGGHRVIKLPVYRMHRLPAEAIPCPAEEIDAVVLTSPRSTRYYVENLGGSPLGCLHIALGPTTQDAARALGIECRIPVRPEMEALAEELCTI